MRPGLRKRAMIRRLLCALGRHRYRRLGDHYKDKIYLCEGCGRRHVEPYTLRIDRLG